MRIYRASNLYRETPPPPPPPPLPPPPSPRSPANSNRSRKIVAHETADGTRNAVHGVAFRSRYIDFRISRRMHCRDKIERETKSRHRSFALTLKMHRPLPFNVERIVREPDHRERETRESPRHDEARSGAEEHSSCTWPN